jgi:uncharacterized C2H2 Zn-finger protein
VTNPVREASSEGRSRRCPKCGSRFEDPAPEEVERALVPGAPRRNPLGGDLYFPCPSCHALLPYSYKYFGVLSAVQLTWMIIVGWAIGMLVVLRLAR